MKRFCLTCAHHRYYEAAREHRCNHGNSTEPSPVTGEMPEPYKSCEMERRSVSATACGMEGRHWTPKQEYELQVLDASSASLITYRPLLPFPQLRAMCSSVAPPGAYMNTAEQEKMHDELLKDARKPTTCGALRAVTRLEHLRYRLFGERKPFGLRKQDVTCVGPYEHEGAHMDKRGNRWED